MFEHSPDTYIRYMDDGLIITSSRNRLRRIVRRVNRLLTDLKGVKHPDKTFIGRAEKGVDFLGVHIKPGQTIRLSRVSLQKLFEKVARLYEQGAAPDRVERYFTHWKGGPTRLT